MGRELIDNSKINKERNTAINTFNKWCAKQYCDELHRSSDSRQFYCNGHVSIRFENQVVKDAPTAEDNWERCVFNLTDEAKEMKDNGAELNVPYTVKELKEWLRNEGKHYQVGITEFKNGKKTNVIVNGNYLLGVLRSFDKRNEKVKFYMKDDNQYQGTIYFKGYDGDGILMTMRFGKSLGSNEQLDDGFIESHPEIYYGKK